jgi:hypothetical protein
MRGQTPDGLSVCRATNNGGFQPLVADAEATSVGAHPRRAHTRLATAPLRVSTLSNMAGPRDRSQTPTMYDDGADDSPAPSRIIVKTGDYSL